MILTKEIERTLIIEYWLDDLDYLECLEQHLRCEIVEGDNTEFVTEVLNEVHSLVVHELNARYKEQAEQQRFIEAFKEVFADEDVKKYWEKDEEVLHKFFNGGNNYVE